MPYLTILWIFFLLNVWEKSTMKYDWVDLCLSHFAWCETTAPNDISGILPWVSTYTPPLPGAGSFSLGTHWHVLWFVLACVVVCLCLCVWFMCCCHVWVTSRFCLALASQAHQRYQSSLLHSISQTQSLWPSCCTPQGRVKYHELSQQLWREHLNTTAKSEVSCKITYRKDTVYLQGKQCHLWSKYR